jgi:transposase-like protein
MSLAGELKQIAQEVADHARARASSLQAQLTQIEAQKTAVSAKLASARLATERLYHFQPEIGGKLQCPRCWIDNELRTALSPIPSITEDDRFRCHICQSEYLF